MTALIIVAIVLLGVASVIDVIVAALGDDDGMTGTALVNLVPIVVAIVALSAALARIS